MKLLRYFPLIIFSFCFPNLNLLAQSSSSLPTVALRTDLISPSPTAQSISRYGIVPVSLSTGIPNISIPLGEAAGREISVPISLGYNHNGLKTYEIASWVGLGWTLNAGGVITRIIKDKVDEATQSTFSYENNIGKYNLQTVSQDYLDGASFKGTYDTEPDLYAFNFGEYSGRFMIYKGKIYQFPYQKLRISGSPSGGFSITTPEGVIYSFSETEETRPKSYQSAYIVPNHISSWFLSTIRSASKKETIVFSYVANAEPTPTHSAASQTLQKWVSGSANNILSNKQVPLPSFVYSKRLVSISTSKMTVNFIPQANKRLDIANNEYALDQVVFSTPKGQVKSFRLTYDYFGDGAAARRSLKLNSIDEQASNAALQRHSFVYESAGTWPVQTDDVDHWGYANGKSGDPVIIPNTVYPYGKDREPNMAYNSLGMLKQVIYPTGGSSVFKFEPNVYGTREHTYKTVLVNAADYLNRTSSSDNTLLTKTSTFTIDSAQTVSIRYARTPKVAVGTTSPNGPDDPTKDLEPEISITSYESRVASRVTDEGVTASAAPTYLIYYNRDNGGLTDAVYLAAGTYQVTLKCDSKEMGTLYSILYVQQTNIPNEGIVGPGLRIKEVLNYPSSSIAGVPLLKKTYKYTDAGGFSTGDIFRTPDYGGKLFTQESANGSTVYEVYTSVINSALGDLLDQDMYYRGVNEFQVSSTDTLRSEYAYNSTNSAPYVYNGGEINLISKTDYKKTGLIYDPVLKRDYLYKQVSIDTFFSALKPYQTIAKMPNSGLLREYGYDWYSLTPGMWAYLDSETQTTYVGGKTSKSTTTYVNDITKNLNLSAVKTQDSQGQERIVKFKYPQDYVSTISQPFIDANVLTPVLEQQVWLKRSATDSVLIAGKVDEYDLTLFKPKASYLMELPSPAASLNQETKSSGLYSSILSDTRFKKRMVNDYDPLTGNLISQDLVSSADTKQLNYIWGYQNSSSTKLYPIAECKNGALLDFFYTGFEDGGSGVVSGSAHTGTNYYAGNYALSFVKPSSTKEYVYSYWYLSAGNWIYSGELKYTGAITLSGEAFDDVRVYPREGQMTTYTYIPEVGISSSTDPKGMTSYYEL
jgi:hypothetical protein